MKNKKIWIMLGVIVVLVLIGSAAIYFFGQNTQGLIRLRRNVKENRVNIEITAGDQYNHTYQSQSTKFTSQPQIAIWAEDMKGNYLSTIFVTRKTAKGAFGSTNGVKNVRNESLPVWSHKAAGDTQLDAVTSATPKGDFTINTPLDYLTQPFMVFLEVNNSADYNDTYSEQNRESGENASLWSGQPSIVYSTAILPGLPISYEFAAVGHGKADGSDGSIDSDLSKLTTAQNILGGIQIEIPQQ